MSVEEEEKRYSEREREREREGGEEENEYGEGRKEINLNGEGKGIISARKKIYKRRNEVDYSMRKVFGWLVSLFNGISTLFRLFNAKAILLEEQ